MVRHEELSGDSGDTLCVNGELSFSELPCPGVAKCANANGIEAVLAVMNSNSTRVR